MTSVCTSKTHPFSNYSGTSGSKNSIKINNEIEKEKGSNLLIVEIVVIVIIIVVLLVVVRVLSTCTSNWTSENVQGFPIDLKQHLMSVKSQVVYDTIVLSIAATMTRLSKILISLALKGISTYFHRDFHSILCVQTHFPKISQIYSTVESQRNIPSRHRMEEKIVKISKYVESRSLP